jgi:hypothetical protein
VNPWQRAAVNRKNAVQSTGPRTQAGKSRSRTNARSHGLSTTLDGLTSGDPVIISIADDLVRTGDGLPRRLAEQMAIMQLNIRKIRTVRAFLIREIETWPREGVARPESDAAKAFRNLGLELASPIAIALRRLLRRLDRAVLLQQETRSEQRTKLFSVLSQLDRYEGRMFHQRNRILREISVSTTW